MNLSFPKFSCISLYTFCLKSIPICLKAFVTFIANLISLVFFIFSTLAQTFLSIASINNGTPIKVVTPYSKKLSCIHLKPSQNTALAPLLCINNNPVDPNV